MTGDQNAPRPLSDTFSARLKRLFETVPKTPGGRDKWSNASVAEAVTQLGVSTTHSHISHMRLGVRNNPSAALVKALADVFRVPVTYFYEDRDGGDVSSELVAALGDAGVRGVALRAQGISEQGMSKLLEMADMIRELEKLPPADL
ncbi:MAG: helix-turn-helix transcriptional regulator [Nakamurella sp.]